MIRTAEEIFLAALEESSPDERHAFLRRACRDDEALWARVEGLIRAHERAGSFLEGPLFDTAATVASDSTSEGAGTQIGPYRLLEAIGEGGMGTVYMAEQTEPVRRRVALKVIKPGMDSKQVIARFEAERQALAMMDHPNIARVLDGGMTPAGRPYFVMELVRGLPVTEYCDQARLSIRERLELFVLVCRAVQHAHQKGVIHRDLKPSNILVTMVDGAAVPKVIDFGIAKATGVSLTDRTLFTGFHQLVGTPLYMSPEQAALSGVDVDTRSDIYSLGVLLYELLTGTTPFEASTFREASFDEIRRILREQEPPTPSSRLATLGATPAPVTAGHHTDPRRLSRSVRGELDWIVMKALEKDRRRRYETASDFAADIARYLEDRPVEACPPSLRYRCAKFAGRNRAALTTAAVVLTALLAGTAVSSWQAVRATRAERDALQAADRERSLADQVREQQRATAAMLSRQQLAGGLGRINDGDSLGLLDLVEAWRTAEDLPELRAAVGQLWAIAHQPWEGRLQWIFSPAQDLAASPDGQLLATCSGTLAQMWDLRTGREHGPPLDLGLEIAALAFSPDGRLLATHSPHGGAQLWEVGSGAPAGPRLPHERSPVNPSNFTAKRYTHSVAFRPDGSLLATAGVDGTVRLWETAGGRPVGEPFACRAPVACVAFSPDGASLAAATWVAPEGHEAEVFAWDVETGQPALPPRSHGNPLGFVRVLFHPDGERLVAASTDGRATAWHLGSGEPAGEMVASDYHEDLIASPDGRWLATGDRGWSAMLWDSATLERVAEFRHEAGVRAIAFHPGGHLLASGSFDATIRLWDMDGRRPADRPLRHRAEVWELAFAPDGSWLAGACKPPDSSLDRLNSDTRVWRLDATPRRNLGTYPDQSRAAAASADGRLVAAITDEGAVLVCDVATGRPVGPPIPVSDVKPTAVAFSPDGRTLAIGAGVLEGPAAVRFWDLKRQRFLPRRLDFRGILHQLAFSTDGARLVTAGTDWRARVWDLDSGEQTEDFNVGSQPTGGVAFHPDGRRMAHGGHDGLARQWDPDTGEAIGPPLRHPGRVTAVAYAPNGRFLATVFHHEDRSHVRLWFIGIDPPYAHFDLPHHPAGRLLRFAADGDLIVHGERPAAIDLWPMPLPPEDLREIELRTWIALALRLRPDGEAEAIPPDRWRDHRFELARRRPRGP